MYFHLNRWTISYDHSRRVLIIMTVTRGVCPKIFLMSYIDSDSDRINALVLTIFKVRKILVP